MKIFKVITRLSKSKKCQTQVRLLKKKLRIFQTIMIKLRIKKNNLRWIPLNLDLLYYLRSQLNKRKMQLDQKHANVL